MTTIKFTADTTDFVAAFAVLQKQLEDIEATLKRLREMPPIEIRIETKSGIPAE